MIDLYLTCFSKNKMTVHWYSYGYQDCNGF